MPEISCETTTPVGLTTTWYPSRRRATAAATCWDSAISRSWAASASDAVAHGGMMSPAGKSEPCGRIQGKSASSSVARREKTSTK